MKKLLFGIFTAIALNVQGQSFGEPQVFEKACYFIHNFVNEDYFFSILDNENKTDRTISIYNDEIHNVKNIIEKDVEHDYNQSFDIGATVYSLIEYQMVNAEHDGGEGSPATQTLFNNDEKWEYIRGTYVYTVENSESYERKEWKLTKAEILDENGKVLTEIPTDAITDYPGSGQPYSYLNVVKMGDNHYILSEKRAHNSSDLTLTTFYKIIKGNSSGIKFTKMAEFKGYPNPVRQNETFTIEVGEENVTSGSFIELCDQSGRMVYRQAIISSKVKVPTRRMKGMYIYNVIASGKSVNTGKVIVQ